MDGPLGKHKFSELPEGRRTPSDLLSVLKNKSKRTKSGCLEYLGRRNWKGYGVVDFNMKSLLAHRASFILEHGAIPKGLQVCHKCDNPPCIEVGHLFLGTNSDNQKDFWNKGNRRVAKTHCKYGHEYSEYNTGHYKNGGRYCKECNREYSTKRRRAKGLEERGPRGHYPSMRKA